MRIISNHQHHMFRISTVRRLAGAVALGGALSLVAVACGDDGSNASVSRSVAIVSPIDGERVPAAFDVDLDVSVPIGEPDTGRNHVHLYYDGNTDDGEYGIAYDDTFTVEGLSPGRHTIQAVIANADHSVTDTRSGVVTVEVTDDATAPSATPAPAPATDEGDDGFGY